MCEAHGLPTGPTPAGSSCTHPRGFLLDPPPRLPPGRRQSRLSPSRPPPWTSGLPISPARGPWTIWTRAPYFPPLPPAPPLGSQAGGAQGLPGTRAPPNCRRSLLLGPVGDAGIPAGWERKGETEAGQRLLWSSRSLPAPGPVPRKDSPGHVRGKGLRQRTEGHPRLVPKMPGRLVFPSAPQPRVSGGGQARLSGEQ